MAYSILDDIYLPGTLSYVATAFTEDQELDVVYGDRIIIDEQDFEIGRWIVPATLTPTSSVGWIGCLSRRYFGAEGLGTNRASLGSSFSNLRWTGTLFPL